MKKRLFSAIMTSILVLSMSLPASAENSIKHSIFSYTVSGDSATITDVEDIKGKVIVPEKIDDYTVTTIGNGAFGGTKNITEVYIPDTVTTMGATCFAYSTSITTVRLSTSAPTVTNGMFNQCSALTGVSIPYGVTTIEENAFSMCPKLVAVTIPNSTKTIADNAFENSPNVKIHCYLNDAGVGYNFAKAHSLPTEELITVYVNNKEVCFDQPPITDPKRFRTLIPLRSVLEEMGADIEWFSGTSHAGITLDGTRLLIKPEEVFMMKNRKRQDLTTPAIIYNDRVLIPIRDVVEAVGADLEWNEFEKTIHITYPKK